MNYRYNPNTVENVRAILQAAQRARDDDREDRPVTGYHRIVSGEKMLADIPNPRLHRPERRILVDGKPCPDYITAGRLLNVHWREVRRCAMGGKLCQGVSVVVEEM